MGRFLFDEEMRQIYRRETEEGIHKIRMRE